MSGPLLDLEQVASCMTLEQLAAQLTAFNPSIGGRLTGKSLEQLVRDGLGTVMGVTGDPGRVHELQRLAETAGHPPLLFVEDAERGERTILPSSLAQSFTWNLDLVEEGARMAAREAASAGYAGILGPVADHSCTNRNGRMMETKGESPWLAARYVERLVRGFQGTSLEHPDTVAATLKHWIGYQCATDGTDYGGAEISDLELLETHAPPFEAGFRAGAAMFMLAFTQLRGIPMHMNAAVNRDLRARLGGAGAVAIGDFTGDVELIEHGVAGDRCDAALKAFAGELHISLIGGSYLACLPRLVETGAIDRAELEARVVEVLKLKAALGLYEDRLRYGQPERDAAPTPDHRTIARRLAREALVMLTQPEAMPLPLEQGARLLVTGPLASDRAAMLGAWSARGRWEDVVTPCDGLQDVFGDERVTCLPIERVQRVRAGEIRAAVAAAGRADAIVVVLGEAAWMSGEASSRLYPTLPPAQLQLVEALAATGKPVVAVVIAGRALPLGELASRAPDGAGGVADVVFFTSQPGIEAGHALADVLGGAHPPSGRLSVSLPCESGIVSASFRARRSGRPQVALSEVGAFRARIGNAGSWVSHFQETFGREDCPIAFPFGHGLTYTDFAFSELELSAGAMSAGDRYASVEAMLTVTNVGRHRGVTVPQLYLRDLVALPAPRRLELKGFRRLELEPGESKQVTFRITPADLARYGIDPRTGALDRELRPQPDRWPVMVFVSDGAEISKETPQGSFVLTP